MSVENGLTDMSLFQQHSDAVALSFCHISLKRCFAAADLEKVSVCENHSVGVQPAFRHCETMLVAVREMEKMMKKKFRRASSRDTA